MTDTSKILTVTTSLIAVLLILPVANLAYAQYMGNVGQSGETGSQTLEESLELARRKVEYAERFPATGSGTPYLDATGILGSTAIAAAVFGGIAGVLFFKGRSGKYAAQGRG